MDPVVKEFFSECWPVLAGVIAGAVVGFFAAALMANRRILQARDRGFTLAENLYLKGKAVDLRDETSTRL